MPLSKEEFERLHTMVVKPIEDATSRFSFEAKCSCGVEGKFYDENSAEQYRQFHIDRKTLRPF